MKTFESGSAIVIALGLFVGGYFFGTGGVTSKDVENYQNEVQREYKVVKGYAMEIKSEYVKRRVDCLNDGKWEQSKKCQAIKKIDPKAQKLWTRIMQLNEELKKANDKTEQVQKHLEKINKMKRIVVKIANAI